MEEGEELFSNVRKYLADQHSKKNYRWIGNVNGYFSGIRKLVNDIRAYNQRTSHPRTWRDHNEITMLLE